MGQSQTQAARVAVLGKQGLGAANDLTGRQLTGYDCLQCIYAVVVCSETSLTRRGG